VHTRHKPVEMDALFVFSRQAIEEHIHQPGFAAPHTAPQVQAGYRRALFATYFCPPAGNRMSGQLHPDAIQLSDGPALRGIGFIATIREQ